jgi:hypothetical protein
LADKPIREFFPRIATIDMPIPWRNTLPLPGRMSIEAHVGRELGHCNLCRSVNACGINSACRFFRRQQLIVLRQGVGVSSSGNLPGALTARTWAIKYAILLRQMLS